MKTGTLHSLIYMRLRTSARFDTGKESVYSTSRFFRPLRQVKNTAMPT